MKYKRLMLFPGIGLFSLFILFMYSAVTSYEPVQTKSGLQKSPFFVYKGVIHVHSKRSDGSGTAEEIAQAAKDVGLDYVIITDHAVGPEARTDEGYYGNVLVMTGSEVNVPEGHILYIPHPDSTFYEHITLLKKHILELYEKALVIGAHPYLPRKPLAKEILHRVGGIEAINLDVQWRSTSKWNLIHAFILYPFMNYSLNSIFYYPERSMRLWENMLERYPNNSIIIGSVDAHANIAITKSWGLRFPSYSRIFKTVQTQVITKEPFSGNFKRDSRLLYGVLRRGAAYICIENLGSAKGFYFSAQSGDTLYTVGDCIDTGDSGENGAINFEVFVPVDDNVRIYLKSPGRTIAVNDGPHLEFETNERGKYFVEVYQLRSNSLTDKFVEVPWIITNAITLR